jgi:PKD repeat protein
MAGLNHVGRNGLLSHGSNAARKAVRTRASANAASGLETLESRVLMSAVRPDAAFSASDLGVGDEKSFPTSGSAGFSLGFSAPINFFGSLYNGVFVNNNGNISLGARNSIYFNADMNALPAKVIAPFYANVDTRFGGSTVRYGRGTVDGHAAFAVNWLNVDFYPSNAIHGGHDSFQLVLVDRSDVAPGSFDMEFNYDSIVWESGANSGGDANGLGGNSARVGWTANNGDASAIFQLAGSGAPGSFLDGNAITGLTHGHFMSDVDGRYVYRFRNGTWADAPSSAVNHDPVVAMPSDQLLVEAADGSSSMELLGSFDDADVNSWTATVDYGDGWGPETLDLSGHGFVLAHTYHDAGSYNVTVTVDDGNGGVGLGTMNVLVEDHSAPIVDVLVPANVNEGDTALLSISLANDPDAHEAYSFEWSGSGQADGAFFYFHADDNGEYTVSLRVTDQSGNSSLYEVPVSVHNVAPTASLSGSDTVAPGETVTLSLDGAADVSAADLAAGLLYSFDFDGDGVYEISGASAAASHVFADPGSHLVRARVSDKDGGSSDYAKSVTVFNLPPVSTGLTNSGDLNEGGTATVTFGPATDSDADLAAGLVYSFDFDGDGLYEVSGASNSASHLFDDNNTYVVHGRVSDVHGAYSEYQTTVRVNNVAPTATLVAPSSGNEGQALAFSLAGVNDASGADRAAGFSYAFDFNNDGLYEVTGTSPLVTHVFDDNGTYTVHARVTDKDGASSVYAGQVTVLNVAPTHGVFLDNNVILEGSAVTVWFVGQDDPSNADTVAGFTYSYDFDNNGVFEVSGRSSSATHVFGDNGVYLVRGRVTDKDGGYTDYTTDVEVANVAPKAVGLSATGTLVEGNTISVRLDGVTDPSAADKAAGFTYSFDLDNNGVFETVGRSSSTTVLVKQDGLYTVRARVTDKDGGYTDYVATGSVANAAPVITSVSNSGGSVGQAAVGTSVLVSAAFSDAGVLDTHTAVIDWGDGSTTSVAPVASNGKGSASGSHKYVAGGVYTVTVTVRDNASPAGVATTTSTVYVTGVGVQNGVLNIVGTNGGDKVSISRDNSGRLKVKTDFGADVLLSSTGVREIQAWLGAGRDNLDVAKDVTLPVYLNGARYATKGVAASILRITRNLFSDRLVA